ncbi:MAG: citramalate synthase [Ruminococcus sp.]|jgi:2-isopropylmalate synthase|nr:citramalate synthase [Ruminococcus sp.]
MKKIEIFDSTLRDGAQGEGISYSTPNKLQIIDTLDRFGVDFIEAGNPASNPKDEGLFKSLLTNPPKYAKIVAFGSTRKKGVSCEDDQGLRALIEAGTEYVSVFGKASLFHVTEILSAKPRENLDMIDETVSFLVSKGKKVFFDAEHFFDGYKEDPEYALRTLLTAVSAGASRIVLCDTNGGTFPDEIYKITETVCRKFADCGVKIGIHCHNDSGCANGNTFAAVFAGATHIQGTFNGYGERCGNANLSAIIPALQLKRGYECVPAEKMVNLTGTARHIAEITNVKLRSDMPFVGNSAFSHKGGMHADGVRKNPASYEQIDPAAVGNERNILLSEMAGRSALISRLERLLPDRSFDKDDPILSEISDILKTKEAAGYVYEAAEASFELMVREKLGLAKDYFDIVYFKIIGENVGGNPSTAIVKIKVGDEEKLSAAEGNGPVNALDKALRHALKAFYPVLSEVKLSDYKVRVVNSNCATAADVRVLIESTDGVNIWTTVGASADVINASLIALYDSLVYKLGMNMNRGKPND